jgi:hypothetical protein
MSKRKSVFSKEARQKQPIIYEANPIRSSVDFSVEKLQLGERER